jgi:methyltransferase (TIGR00027 family)
MPKKEKRSSKGEMMAQVEHDLKPSHSSGTAEEIALHRAIENTKPENERICQDAFAFNFLSSETRKFYDLLVIGSDKAKAMLNDMNRQYPGTHNSIVARVRFIDETVQASVNEGVRQLVILGAGYDTRAYRIKGLERMIVFEVDHPDTQAIKVETIKKITGSIPDNIRYVAVDLEKDDLGQKIERERI